MVSLGLRPLVTAWDMVVVVERDVCCCGGCGDVMCGGVESARGSGSLLSVERVDVGRWVRLGVGYQIVTTCFSLVVTTSYEYRPDDISTCTAEILTAFQW